MADHSKRIAQDAREWRKLIDSTRRGKAKDAEFLCACGAFPTWVEPAHGNRVALYCEGCRVKAGLKV